MQPIKSIPELINQPSALPMRKIMFGAGFGAPVGVVVSFFIKSFLPDLPEEVSLAINTLVGAGVTAVIAYMTKERAPK